MTVIRDALVVDGTGAAPFGADVVVRGERIVALHPPRSVAAADVDAAGLVLAPGFIDVHSHSDNVPLHPTDDTAKLLQGVTTEVVGNCGFSLAPVADPALAATYAEQVWPPTPLRWRGFSGLFRATDEAGYVTNYVPLAGHGMLRIAGGPAAPLDGLLDEALDAGCFGFSTGLAYAPGAEATTDELIALARRLGPDGIYTTHLRNEGAGLLDAVAEAIHIGREAGCRVQISHLKSPAALELLDEARGEGLRIGQDIYPYTASSTMLSACFPPPVQHDLLTRLSQRDSRAALRDLLDTTGWDNHVAAAGYEGITVASTGSGRFQGRTLAQLADDLAFEPFDALAHVLLEEGNRANMIVDSLAEADISAVLRHPCSTVGTDGAPPGFGTHPHPRAYGSFPRVLGRCVRERGLLDLSAAVRMMTSRAAEQFGLPDRGRIAVDAVADLVLFDADEITDRATYAAPTRPPQGIHRVYLAGREVVRAGELIERRRGRRLSPTG